MRSNWWQLNIIKADDWGGWCSAESSQNRRGGRTHSYLMGVFKGKSEYWGIIRKCVSLKQRHIMCLWEPVATVGLKRPPNKILISPEIKILFLDEDADLKNHSSFLCWEFCCWHECSVTFTRAYINWTWHKIKSSWRFLPCGAHSWENDCKSQKY